ncbi:hypothetical protein Goklo_023098, partial [Gossypium klotzschianum]|nr:hypothetical protein [Gossypium klotzschianum]
GKSVARWFTYIKKNLSKIFQNTDHIWARESDERRCKSIYIEYASNRLFITDPNGGVKILPNLDTPNGKMKDDIDELKVLMDFIINYPFGPVIRNYNQCRLLAKLEAFLGYLDSIFL